MNATPAAVRKQQGRDRKREAGMVLVQAWVHQDDAERLRNYAAKLRKTKARPPGGKKVELNTGDMFHGGYAGPPLLP